MQRVKNAHINYNQEEVADHDREKIRLGWESRPSKWLGAAFVFALMFLLPVMLYENQQIFNPTPNATTEATSSNLVAGDELPQSDQRLDEVGEGRVAGVATDANSGNNANNASLYQLAAGLFILGGLIVIAVPTLNYLTSKDKPASAENLKQY